MVKNKIMKKHKTVVGKNLIDILMFSMYPDAKIIYREYIQNARDAINDAVNAGVLEEFKDGHIVIDIDSNKNKIQISDNGVGVPVSDVQSTLLNIADSSKDGENSAGQFGIGRLVGGGYCKKLSFKTSFKGESQATEIIFDIEKARAILHDKKDRRSASEVIDAISETINHDEEESKHYFTVTLEGVRSEYPELLDEKIIGDYLKEVAPIDYTLPFKNQLVSKSSQGEYVNLQNDINFFKISINDNLDIRKRYGLSVEGTGDDIHSLEYFKIQDDEFGLLAWGWYAVTEFSKAIPASDKNRGFRLRKHNIQIGAPNVLNQYFKESRGNNYLYGEIHAIHPKLKPESSRSGLAPTPEALRLQAHLRDYFSILVSLYNFANDVKNAAKKVDAAVMQVGISATKSPEAERELEEAKKKLETLKRSKHAQTDPAKKVLEIYAQKRQDIALEFVSDIGAKATTAPAKKKKNDDLFEPLKNKYPNDKIILIKRIFAMLSEYCPTAQQKLIEELKKKVIKDLEK